MSIQRCLLLILLLLAAGVAGAETRPTTATAGVQVLTPPLAMSGLNRQRTIRVYLPPSYHHGGRKYPVLYMHDGQNLFDDATSYLGEWGVDESLDALAKSDGIEVIVVGIDNGLNKRMNELSPWPNDRFGAAEGQQYMEFVVGTVKPFIDRNFRTRRGRKHTGIMGSSMGGLISHYAIHRYPAVFGKAGIFSPSYWYAGDVFDFSAARRLRRGTRLYLVAGGKEGDEPLVTVNDVNRMSAQLRASNRENLQLFTAIRPDAEHNEKFWREEFPKAMIYLFGEH